MSIEEKLIQEYNERDISSGKIYKLSLRMCDAEEKISKELNDNQKELFRKFNESHDKYLMTEIDEALIYGFRFAISLINDWKKINF